MSLLHPFASEGNPTCVIYWASKRKKHLRIFQVCISNLQVGWAKKSSDGHLDGLLRVPWIWWRERERWREPGEKRRNLVVLGNVKGVVQLQPLVYRDDCICSRFTTHLWEAVVLWANRAFVAHVDMLDTSNWFHRTDVLLCQKKWPWHAEKDYPIHKWSL